MGRLLGAAEIAQKGLVLNLPFYDTNLKGDTFRSMDWVGHECTTHHPIWRPDGRSLDGIDDYILAGNHPAIRISNEITLSCWFFPRKVHTCYLFHRMTSDWATHFSGYRVDIRDNGEIGFLWSDGKFPPQTTASSRLYTAGSWNLCDITLRGLEFVRFFFNGELDVEAIPTRPLADADASLLISTSWNPFNGIIGGVRIYNRALTPEEVRDNYIATKFRYK